MNSSAPTPLLDRHTCSAEENLLGIIYLDNKDAFSDSETFCTSVSEINQFMHTHKHIVVLCKYLYGVIENQRVKLSQVLDMVALNYMAVLFHKSS